jgi:signal transduction histidine kinase
VYADLKQFDKAMAYQLQGIEIERNIGNKRNMGISYNEIAALLIRTNRLKEAEQYLEQARKLALQINSKLMLRNNAGHFADLFELRGEYKKALDYRKRYQSLNDSIYSEVSAGKLAEMQAMYQLEKKDQEIELLNKEGALQESQLTIHKAQIRQQRMLIAFGSIGILLISIIAFVTYRYYRRLHRLNIEISEQHEEIQAQAEELTESNQALTSLNNEIIEKNEEIQAQSEELIEANETIAQITVHLEDKVAERTTKLRQAYKELDTFFYRASHDFRRPLTTFMGLAEVAKVTVKDQNALELFTKVKDTAHYLDKMLLKLQSISDVGGQELVYKEVFIEEIFNTVCDSFRELLDERHIKTSCDVLLQGPFYSYPALVKIVVENLIENSIFFSRPNGPFVKLKAFESDTGIVLEISDNGEGIKPEFHERIFEMYFRANERSKGNGLGLYIVKKAVEKLSGIISVHSDHDVGSSFRIIFDGNKNTSVG